MVTRFLAACLTLGVAFGGSVAFAQSNDDDIARFEEKMASQKLALEIYERAQDRAWKAFKNSPTGSAIRDGYGGKKVWETVEGWMTEYCLRDDRENLVACLDEVFGKDHEYGIAFFELRDEFIIEEIEKLGLEEKSKIYLEKKLIHNGEREI